MDILKKKGLFSKNMMEYVHKSEHENMGTSNFFLGPTAMVLYMGALLKKKKLPSWDRNIAKPSST